MPIALISAGEDIPTVAKRGRSRPPGVKNKQTAAPPPVAVPEPEVAEAVHVVAPATAPVTAPEAAPVVAPAAAPQPETESEPETEETASEEEDTPPPPPRKRRPPPSKPKAKPNAKASRLREEPPESPRAVAQRQRLEYRDAQSAALNHREDKFAVILDRFMR